MKTHFFPQIFLAHCHDIVVTMKKVRFEVSTERGLSKPDVSCSSDFAGLSGVFGVGDGWEKRDVPTVDHTLFDDESRQLQCALLRMQGKMPRDNGGFPWLNVIVKEERRGKRKEAETEIAATDVLFASSYTYLRFCSRDTMLRHPCVSVSLPGLVRDHDPFWLSIVNRVHDQYFCKIRQVEDIHHFRDCISMLQCKGMFWTWLRAQGVLSDEEGGNQLHPPTWLRCIPAEKFVRVRVMVLAPIVQYIGALYRDLMPEMYRVRFSVQTWWAQFADKMEKWRTYDRRVFVHRSFVALKIMRDDLGIGASGTKVMKGLVCKVASINADTCDIYMHGNRQASHIAAMEHMYRLIFDDFPKRRIRSAALSTTRVTKLRKNNDAAQPVQKVAHLLRDGHSAANPVVANEEKEDEVEEQEDEVEEQEDEDEKVNEEINLPQYVGSMSAAEELRGKFELFDWTELCDDDSWIATSSEPSLSGTEEEDDDDGHVVEEKEASVVADSLPQGAKVLHVQHRGNRWYYRCKLLEGVVLQFVASQPIVKNECFQ